MSGEIQNPPVVFDPNYHLAMKVRSDVLAESSSPSLPTSPPYEDGIPQWVIEGTPCIHEAFVSDMEPPYDWSSETTLDAIADAKKRQVTSFWGATIGAAMWFIPEKLGLPEPVTGVTDIFGSVTVLSCVYFYASARLYARSLTSFLETGTSHSDSGQQ